MQYYYVYILEDKNESHHYTGITKNMKCRLMAHNSGKNISTSANRPWRVKTAIAFTDRQRALEFEKYLKSPSGRAFALKRL
ncbi:MAG: GIY-YIG nuclease family protein [Planctomycetota bacterium]